MCSGTFNNQQENTDNMAIELDGTSLQWYRLISTEDDYR